MVTTAAEPMSQDAGRKSSFGSESFWRLGRSSTSLALLDQAVLSGTSFLMIVVLKRFSGLEAVGLYSLAYSILMVALCFQRSLTISPYTIFCRRVDEYRRAEMRASARMQVIAFALIGSVICSAVWLVVRGYTSGYYLSTFAIMILALPAELFKDYFRSMAISDGRFSGALKIDISTSVFQMIIVGVLCYLDRLDATTAIAALLVSRLIVASVFYVITIKEHRWAATTFVSDVQKSWSLGSWLMLSQVTHAAQSYVLHWTVAITLGISQSGTFTACWTVVQLISPFVQGLGNAFEPQIASEHAKNGIHGVKRFVARASALVGVIAFLYWSVLAVFGSSILALLYGNDVRSDAMLTVILATGAAILAIGMAAGKGLAVLEHPNLSFFSTLAGLVLSLLTTIVLINTLGTIGAAVGSVVGAVVTTGIRWAMFRRVSRNQENLEILSHRIPLASGDQV